MSLVSALAGLVSAGAAVDALAMRHRGAGTAACPAPAPCAAPHDGLHDPTC